MVYSETSEAHYHHLRQVLQQLSNNGLKSKPAKHQFGMQKCIYCGHVVGNDQVWAAESKLRAVETFAVPATNRRRVCAFLGLTGYYQRFVPDHVTLAPPLTNLTRKSASSKMDWTAHCEHAFQEQNCTSALHQFFKVGTSLSHLYCKLTLLTVRSVKC